MERVDRQCHVESSALPRVVIGFRLETVTDMLLSLATTDSARRKHPVHTSTFVIDANFFFSGGGHDCCCGLFGPSGRRG